MISSSVARLAAVVAVGALTAVTAPTATAVPPMPATACNQGVPQPTALVGVVAGKEHWLRTYVHAAGLRAVGALPQIGALQIAFPSGEVRAKHLSALRRQPLVTFADPETRYSVLDTPTDPLFTRQWALQKVSAPMAWGIEAGLTSPVTVAVLDTGIDFEHPDFQGKLLPGFNALDPGTPPQDDHSHGTHVSGIIAAATNNRLGMAGLSWGARILPVKPMDAGGNGTTCEIVASILYVATQAPDVLNMSIGTPTPCPGAMQAAIDLAHRAGVLSVAATGNSGGDFNIPNSPANCERVLAVGATDERDRIAGFSNYGSYVDVSAPGVNILSAVLDPGSGARGYQELSGTSMASPMAAGLAALLASRHPTWSPDQIADRIIRTADDRGKNGWDPYFGHGRINVLRAVQ